MKLVSPIRRLALPLLTLALAAAPAAFAQEQAATPSGPATQVETKKVCMVNDALFQKDQIPVEVEGKTYYGCCQMCKARLAEDAAVRSAVDPVTGKDVDKATAVPGALADGTVLYFESAETLAQYNEKAGPAESSGDAG
jgi:YHS domain-containing protein